VSFQAHVFHVEWEPEISETKEHLFINFSRKAPVKTAEPGSQAQVFQRCRRGNTFGFGPKVLQPFDASSSIKTQRNTSHIFTFNSRLITDNIFLDALSHLVQVRGVEQADHGQMTVSTLQKIHKNTMTSKNDIFAKVKADSGASD
jgi:hypothetical protein